MESIDKNGQLFQIDWIAVQKTDAFFIYVFKAGLNIYKLYILLRCCTVIFTRVL